MKTVILWILGIGALIILTGANIRAGDPLTPQKDQAREAISLCDDKVNDTLLPTDQRLFIRNTCDMMRRNFQAKYGYTP